MLKASLRRSRARLAQQAISLRERRGCAALSRGLLSRHLSAAQVSSAGSHTQQVPLGALAAQDAAMAPMGALRHALRASSNAEALSSSAGARWLAAALGGGGSSTGGGVRCLSVASGGPNLPQEVRLQQLIVCRMRGLNA